MDRGKADRRRGALIERYLADGFFYLLLATAVVLSGWLAARHDRFWDWTTSRRNSLSQESELVVARLMERQSDPLRITVFADRHHPVAGGISQLLARYRPSGLDLAVTFVDPQLFPEEARAAEVSLLGQMLLEYRGRRETLSELSEAALTAAIARLDRDQVAWVAVLEGHGERSIEGQGATGLARFADFLRGQGLRLQPLDLARRAAVPDNTRLLLLSVPAIDLFPGEIEGLIDYLERGGNLLWLMDPGDLGGLAPLLDYLGIVPLPGILVDANVGELNIQDPTVAMVASYPDQPPTRGLAGHSLFPGALAFRAGAAAGWSWSTPLETQQNSWNETGPIRGNVFRDPDLDELPGPLPLALLLSRPHPDGAGEQQVLVVGDGDFLSNAYLDSAGNRALALRLVHWLTAPEGVAAVPARHIEDRTLVLTRTQILVVGGGSLLGLPLLFLTTGLVVRWRRRRG